MPQNSFENNRKVIPLQKKQKHTLKTNPRKFQMDLIDALWNALDGDYGAATKKIISNIGEEGKIQRSMFSLFFKALISASRFLPQTLYPQKWLKSLKSGLKMPGLENDLHKALKEEDIYISMDFFDNPLTPFVRKYQSFYKDWLLKSVGLTEEEALNLALKLPMQFINELSKEWEENSSRYDLIIDYLADSTSPFENNISEIKCKQDYRENLRSLYLQPALGEEKVPLNDIYIEPSFSIHQRNIEESNRSKFRFDVNGFPKSTIYNGSLINYIKEHFLRTKPAFEFTQTQKKHKQDEYRSSAEKSRFIILLGHPGQGKTSLCYKLIHDFLNDLDFDKEVCFLKLRELNHPRDFLNRPIEEIENLFRNNKAIQLDLSNCFVILDGLDELFMDEGLKANEISDCLHNISKKVNGISGLYLLITSRFHYVDLKRIGEKEALIISISPLNHLQQKEWLTKYLKFNSTCKLTIEILNNIQNNRGDKLNRIGGLIGQPILLHAIAKANFDIIGTDNAAKIYDNLFTSLTKRTWDNYGQFDKLQGLKENPNAFREFIGALALKVFLSHREYLTEDEIIQVEETRTFIRYTLDLNEAQDLRDILREVLITFHFNEVHIRNIKQGIKEKNIEFLHKPLQEYLAAERIWYLFKEKFLEKTTRKNKSRYTIDNWQAALDMVWKIGGVKPLSPEVSSNLMEVIYNDKDVDDKMDLSDRLQIFLPDLLDQNFLLGYPTKTSNFDPILKACSCFHIYWLVLSSISNDNVIEENSISSFCKILRVNQIYNYHYIDLSYQNLRFSDLSNANLSWANFEMANLRGIDLDGSRLDHSNFSGANLAHVHMSRLFLNSNMFLRSNLYEVDLSNSMITHVEFQKASLKKLNFDNTKFSNVSYDKSTIEDTSWKCAEILDTYFENTILDKMEFLNSTLKNLTFKDSKLTNCSYRYSTLLSVDFIESELFALDFSFAKLMGVDFTNCSMEDISFKEAHFDSRCKISLEQLLESKSLYNCTGLKDTILQEIKVQKPSLLEK